MSEQEFRIEHDTMGEVKVPVNALWRAQTQRAVENFPISDRPLEATQIRAMGLLKKGGYVITNEEGCLSLTETGRELASKIYERHTVLTDLLVRLGVDRETAAEDACRMEHVISDQSFQAIRRHAGR